MVFHEQPHQAKTLDEEEIARECAAIREMGFEHLLLVTGEHQGKWEWTISASICLRYVGSLRRCRWRFSPVAGRVCGVKTLGLDGVMVYQETYREATYARHHLKGKKQDFFSGWKPRTGWAAPGSTKSGWVRYWAFRQLAGCYMVAEHLLWLQQHYWQTRYSISFPRLRPCAGGIEPASLMDERQLVQTICAFRLLAPEVELSLSTRESPAFRDRVIPLAINNVSAFSKTQPGGYADDHPELEQFAPHDGRRPEAVAAALTAQGLQPVWKDWDSWLGRASQ